MKVWELQRFGIDGLHLVDQSLPDPGPGKIRVRVKALSINFRDLMVIVGSYNPRLKLPCTVLSDMSGVVSAVGEGARRFTIGDRVMSHFVADWIDGPYEGRYLATTLGTPGPGVAAEEIVLSEQAALTIPTHLNFAAASTLPIAALTAWSALVTEGRVQQDHRVLTLGTGGVSIFALRISKALGARCIVTSSSDAKLARAKELGADALIHYGRDPDWEKRVLEYTEGSGVHVVVENGGVATLTQSLKAVRPGGTIAMLGALTGLEGKVNISPILMKRVRVAGILVDSRAAFLEMSRFFEKHRIQPVIDSRFGFDQLPAALQHMKDSKHFGKIVIDVE